MATWPTSLPTMKEMGEITAEADETIQRYDMSWGLSIQRRKFTTYAEKFELGTYMTRTQLSTLYNFFDNTLLNGSARFAWEHPITYVPCEAQFYKRFTFRQEDTNILRVTLHLEVLP